MLVVDDMFCTWCCREMIVGPEKFGALDLVLSRLRCGFCR